MPWHLLLLSHPAEGIAPHQTNEQLMTAGAAQHEERQKPAPACTCDVSLASHLLLDSMKSVLVVFGCF